MFVGALLIDLYMRESATLKDKRQVIRRIIDRTRNRFNVSVAEMGDLDSVKRGSIAIACVCNSEYVVREMLAEIERAVLSWSTAEIVSCQRHIFSPE
jgi:uncharacterized protein YlxP (DUF503 family)